MSNLLNLYLNNFHTKNEAKFIPFAGYSMPINYSEGIINEHKQVREHVGVFDVSHMGQVAIRANENNIKNLEKYIPLQLKNLKKNKSYYSFFLNDNGCVIDDMIISLLNLNNKSYFYIVYNASRKKNNEIIFKENLFDYKIINNNCLLAIQGPLSYKILSKLIKINPDMNFFDVEVIPYKMKNIILSRSGYTGEDGFELSIPCELSESFLDQLLSMKGCKLCGLGARDSLRIEAGLSLYGNELSENITPIEAGLLWALDINRINSNDLNGHKNLKSQIRSKPKLIKIGMFAQNKVILRKNMNLLNKENKNIGIITSGCYSPVLSKSIALGYINKNYDLNNNFYCKIRNNLETISYSKLPFILKKYKKE